MPSKTRKALLERKNQIELARQGRDLLEEKQTALIRELQQVIDEFNALTEEAEGVAYLAREALARANAFAGEHAVKSAAMREGPSIYFELHQTTTMGVVLPRFILETPEHIPRFDAAVIDEAAIAFRRWIEMIFRLAEMRLRVKRLVDELDTTSRRLNALDHKTIPRLQGERDSIELALAERERATQTRLKIVKKLRQS